MSVFFAVYLGVWVIVGLVAVAGERLASQSFSIGVGVLLSVALAVAAGWQLSRAKRRALFRCRRTVPLPPIGLRADAGCARFALQQGWRCVISCWALMIVMTLVQRSALVWMVALTALVVGEEMTRLGWRLLRPSAAALAVATGLVALGAG